MEASYRILIVEDNLLIALALKRMLTKLGHEIVEHATHAEEALRLAEMTALDLAIVDVGLDGDADGCFVAQELRHTWRLPSIITSGVLDEKTKRRFAGSYPPAYLTKPYGFDALEKALVLTGATLNLRDV